MLRTTLSAFALAVVATLPAGAQQTGGPAAAKPAATPSTSSSERLARIRQALQNQIAVHDAGEGAMRAPSAAEAAALSGAPAVAAGRTAQVVTLPGGGAALRADASSLSFLVVETQGDGKLAIRHESAKAAKAQRVQGGVHAH